MRNYFKENTFVMFYLIFAGVNKKNQSSIIGFKF